MWTGLFTPFWIGCGNWLLLVRRLIWNTKELRNSSICAATVQWIDLYCNFKSLLFTVLFEKENFCFECVRACVRVCTWVSVCHITQHAWYLLLMLLLVNPLNAELNPICYLLALLGAHHFLHVSRIRVKSLTFRPLMSYTYGAPILDVSRSHTTTHHSR